MSKSRTTIDPRYFRFLDSGDIQSVQHLENMAEIARQLPHIKFWISSREITIIREWFEAGHKRPKNLSIRVSANIINGPLPYAFAKRYGIGVSGVHTKDKLPQPPIRICEANTRGGVCGPCRMCWDNRIKAVSYKLH